MISGQVNNMNKSQMLLEKEPAVKRTFNKAKFKKTNGKPFLGEELSGPEDKDTSLVGVDFLEEVGEVGRDLDGLAPFLEP